MKKLSATHLLTLLVALLVELPGAYAADDDAQVRQKLVDAFPSMPVGDIKPSPVPGFKQVEIGGLTVYVSDSGEFMFAGELYVLEPGGPVNATEAARNETRRELLASIDESDMVVFSPPAERVKTTITVFTDIDCGYCRKLHQEVPELNRLGIAVRYLAYPRAGIGSASYDKLVHAWCAEDREEALTRAKRGQSIPRLNCANPVAAHFALGPQFGVRGTPAIVKENGELHAGYAPAAELADILGVPK